MIGIPIEFVIPGAVIIALAIVGAVLRKAGHWEISIRIWSRKDD